MPDRDVEQVIADVCRKMSAHYVFPDVAEEVVGVLRARSAGGSYTELDHPALAEAVTADLQSVNGDKHLRLRHHIEPLHAHREEPEGFAESERAEAAQTGHGIARVERLDGNVGYLDIRFLFGPEISGEVQSAAMTLLASTDALLIDVRRNRGGSPAAVALICTYLFDGPTHLSDIYFREGDRTEQVWTLPYVPGPAFGADKPVYVLTGPDTFSAGEDLAYTLQQLGRARTVGETTRGGAHPREQYRVDTHLDVTISFARSINLVSGTNWEGTGVRPDVPAPAADAFERAYRLALEDIGTSGARDA